jgi:hypothetical protein
LSRGTTAGKPAASHAIPNDTIASAFQAAVREDTGETSRMIANDVLPLYASLFTNATAQMAVPKNVTVTLVRWPYT